MNRFIKDKAPVVKKVESKGGVQPINETGADLNKEVVPKVVIGQENQLEVCKEIIDDFIIKDEIEQIVADAKITTNEPTIKDEVIMGPTNWIYKNFTIEGTFQKLNKDSIVSRKIMGGAEYSDPLFDAIRQCVNTDPRCILENIKIKQPNGGTQLIVIGTNYNDKHCSIEAMLHNPNDKIQHIVKFFKEKFKRIVETNDFTKEYFI